MKQPPKVEPCSKVSRPKAKAQKQFPKQNQLLKQSQFNSTSCQPIQKRLRPGEQKVETTNYQKLSGPKSTGQKIDLTQFNKPKKAKPVTPAAEQILQMPEKNVVELVKLEAILHNLEEISETDHPSKNASSKGRANS